MSAKTFESEVGNQVIVLPADAIVSPFITDDDVVSYTIPGGATVYVTKDGVLGVGNAEGESFQAPVDFVVKVLDLAGAVPTDVQEIHERLNAAKTAEASLRKRFADLGDRYNEERARRQEAEASLYGQQKQDPPEGGRLGIVQTNHEYGERIAGTIRDTSLGGEPALEIEQGFGGGIARRVVPMRHVREVCYLEQAEYEALSVAGLRRSGSLTSLLKESVDDRPPVGWAQPGGTGDVLTNDAPIDGNLGLRIDAVWFSDEHWNLRLWADDKEVNVLLPLDVALWTRLHEEDVPF